MNNSGINLWKVSIGTMALGLLLCAIGFFNGGAKPVIVNQKGVHLLNNTPQNLTQLNLSPFDAIDFDIHNANIDFIPSSSYGIEMNYYGDTNKPSYTLANNTLKISDEKDNLFSFINMDFGFLKKTNTIKVYLPANVTLKTVTIKDLSGDLKLGGFSAKNTDINASFGNLEIDNVVSDTLTLTVGSGSGIIKNTTTNKLLYSNSFGSSTLENINATAQNAEITAKSGDITIKNFNANALVVNNSFGDITMDHVTVAQLTSLIKSGDYKVRNSTIGRTDVTSQFGKIDAEDITTTQLNAKCKSGDMKLRGTFTGNTIIESEFGKVDFSTPQKETQYSYDLSTKFGDVKVNGDKATAKNKQNIGAENTLKISNSSGDIDVRFDK
jgi:DUF4097 and DUF4098 domain-containing protein YvlB